VTRFPQQSTMLNCREPHGMSWIGSAGSTTPFGSSSGTLTTELTKRWGQPMVRRRRVLLTGLVGAVVLLAAGCEVPLSAPGNTAKIQFVSTSNSGGWKYDYYRNPAYPCSVSGDQTFVIGTKIGSSNTAPAPLFAHLHGGGAGFFDANGDPQPSAGQKTEESFSKLRQKLTNNGLFALVRADAASFRMLAVSYCSHDIYSGANSTDPNNPNTTPEGKPRTTNGLLATKAAVQYARGLYPTTKTLLHGGSAGSAGVFGVAWSMQLHGIAPAGAIADASVANIEALEASFVQGVCVEDSDPARIAALQARVHTEIGDIDNEVDKLVADGRLTVPLMHIWNHGDQNTCGAVAMTCPLRDGSQVAMGRTDCLHEPLRAAIAAPGAASRSANLPVCVDADAIPDCSAHVVTNKVGLVNTDPTTPADYLGEVMDWVHARLADA